MEISVLAVKCMYCGEKVGRPKDEQRNLTVDDLGGESGLQYTPSSSVMEALESFRVEETLDSGPIDEGLGSETSGLETETESESQTQSSANAELGLPELDERSRALASVALPSQSTTNIYKRKSSQGSVWKQRLLYLGGAVVGVLVLYIIVTQVSAMMANRNPPPVVRQVAPPNPAEAMLENGAPPVEILKAAAQALDEHDIPRNRQVMKEARANLISHVEGLLNGAPFKQSNLSQASKIMGEALKHDPNPQITRLKAEVDEDCKAYVMAMRFEDDSAKLTTFVDGQKRRTTVQQGDDVGMNGRFKVHRVTKNAIRLRDTLRQNRNVEVTLDGQVKAW
jgi:hypothetical protein